MIFILSNQLTTKGLMTLAIAIKHVPARYSQAGHDEFAVHFNTICDRHGTIMKKICEFT